MTVHIREFVMRLGVDGAGTGGSTADQSAISREEFEKLRQELTRQIKSAAGGNRPQPFDR